MTNMTNMFITAQKRVLLMFIATFLTLTAVAQVDSMLYLADSYASAQERLAFLNEACLDYSASLSSGAEPLFEKHLKEYEESGLEGDLMRRVVMYARYKLFRGEIDEAKAIMLRYEGWEKESTDLAEKRKYWYNLSFIEERGEIRDSALTYIDKAILLSEELGDSSNIIFGEVHKAKGRVLSSLSRYGESMVSLNKAKRIFMATADSIGIAESMVELGILHAMIGLFDESEKFMISRYDYLKNPDITLRLRDAANLGRNDLIQNKFDSAYNRYRWFYEQLPLDESQSWFEIYGYNGLIESMYFSKREQDIPALYQEMMGRLGSFRSEDGFEFLFDQSMFFSDLVSGNYRRAEKTGLQLYERSVQKEDGSESMLHARFLTELYKRSGEPLKALRFSEIYGAARDSMLTANKTNVLLLYQTTLKTKEKENQIVQLASEKEIEESKSRFYLSMLGGLLAVFLIGGGLFFKLRKTRDSLAKRNVELAKLNATRNKFFGIIGHDLRNPIVTFQAIGNRIRRQKAKGNIEDIDSSLDLLSKSTKQVSGLLDNLLKWALSQNGIMPYQPEELMLEELIAHNVSLFKEIAEEKGVTLSVDITEQLRLVADRDAMSGVCRNLLSNAIKYTARGGQVTIKAIESKDKVLISFSDTGVGMNEEQQKTLFGLGVKSKRGTEGESGTGLGLILVKELVELNKGEVSVESQRGIGTTFHLAF